MRLLSTLFLNAALFVVLLAPAMAWAQGTTVSGTIRFAGVVRQYRLYVPAVYNTTSRVVPLLFNLHGYGSNNIEQEQYGEFRPIADTANFLVVHPNGAVNFLGARDWNTFGPRGTGVDDVAFLSALLDTIASRYRVDPDRVYSTGMSNGGFMSYELACQLSNRVAAIASVTGSMTADRLSGCAATRPVPVLEIHGTADGTVPYTGGGTFQFVAIPTLLANWVQRNGANPTPAVTMVPDINTTDGCTAERSVWSGGRNGSVVEHYRIIGGGHTWPGAIINRGVTNRDINASREIWRFLRPFRLSRLSLSAAASQPRASFTVQPNPAFDAVIIRAADKLSANSVVVHDALGRAVAAQAQPNEDGSLRLATSTWRNGVYLLRLQLPNGQVLQQKLMKE